MKFPPMPIEEQEEPPLPEGIGALGLLRMVYQGKAKVSSQQMRAAIESLPFEEPKLSAVAHASLTGEDFASMLDKAIRRSMAGPPRKLFEAQAIEVEEGRR